MLKKRIIPVLTFDGRSLVKTIQFSKIRTVGNPIQTARVFNTRNVDELVFIDIKATTENRKINLQLVKKIIDECYMPVTIGGGINSIEDISKLLNIGADKILLNDALISDPKFVSNAVNYFGSQCISASIDVFKSNAQYFIRNNYNQKLLASEFLKKIKNLNIGEIILNSVNCDGVMKGFDLEISKLFSNEFDCPVITIGGAGNLTHFEDLYRSGFEGDIGVSSLFYFTQYTPNDVKRVLRKNNIPVRLDRD